MSAKHSSITNAALLELISNIMVSQLRISINTTKVASNLGVAQVSPVVGDLSIEEIGSRHREIEFNKLFMKASGIPIPDEIAALQLLYCDGSLNYEQLSEMTHNFYNARGK